jgi:hypothetical protein
MLVVGLSATIAKARDGNPPVFAARIPAEEDLRLAKLTGAQPQKFGIFTYYPNKGGGYTFTRNGQIEFYALPYVPSAYDCVRTVLEVTSDANDNIETSSSLEVRTCSTIGTTRLTAGGQTVFRSEMYDTYPGVFIRNDIPIAAWCPDAPDGQFHLSIIAEDSETRVKLKSIIPVLEDAEHAR